MFILHINTIILALLYLGQCTNMLIITVLVCHSAVSGYLSYSRSTPFLNGLSPIIMSCAARKKLMLCIRWMRTVYIDFIFIGNIPAMVFITIKNTTHNIKTKLKFFLYWLYHGYRKKKTNTLASRVCLWLLQFTKFRLMLHLGTT